ncbi:MAG TPA: 3'(2'),5'-bisphosphate nucleotidase CysQ [Xanthobacteraceae bacterium]|nr:3'(2'),5'-bisphosphate nucleotidase CysQ [Xanthobacteraceae bacterium]
MPATKVDLVELGERLEGAVREAGVLARGMFGTALKNWTKGPAASPVCEADIAVDDLLRARLFAGNDGIAWLSEESADDPARLEARYVWIIDPIDGTRAYIAGLPDWAVSAALIADGRPVVACLYAPVADQFFAARASAGATCNGSMIVATQGAELAGARIAGPRNLLERLPAVMPPFTAMPRLRSLALRLAQVAHGTCDVAFAGGNSHDWDLAAADLLVHEAGGALTSITGGTVAYNRPVPRHGMLVAAGRDRHAALIELLRDGRLAFP